MSDVLPLVDVPIGARLWRREPDVRETACSDDDRVSAGN
jgi:hypothetical protein